MADIILGSFVGSILERLRSLASHEIGQASCVKLELEEFKNTVSAIGAVLDEARKRGAGGDKNVIRWLKKLRDVVYDADDQLEDFFAEAQRQREIRGNHRILIFFSTYQLVYSLKMSRHLKSIRERLDQIYLRGSLWFGTRVLEDRTRRQTDTDSSLPQYVVGRESDKKQILEFLFSADNIKRKFAILAIVGMGGLGKTVLAKLVFRDERVQRDFDLTLWVSESTDIDLKSYLRGLVQLLTPGRVLAANLNMEQLYRLLNEELKGRTVFLVLDDVWNENRDWWLELRTMLDGAANEVKILVTTRSLNVGRAADAALIYQLPALPEDESLSLFMEVAATQEHEWQGLEAIRAVILRKCCGVPLVIILAGDMTQSAHTTEDLLRFMVVGLSKLTKEFMAILQSSYHNLPSHLQQCFAYCSLFPKGYRFDPLELIPLWIAQGYIKSLDNSKTLEELGREYFMELVLKSFFTDIEEDVDGNVIGCKMHNLIHDLAIFVAGDGYSMLDGFNGEMVPESAFHVSTYLIDSKLIRVGERNKSRTLLFLDEQPRGIEGSCDWDNFILHFQKLQALRLQGAPNLRQVPSRVGKLKYLRYLDLSKNGNLRVLPNSIGELWYLETLNLQGCCQLQALPRSISELANLRQLDRRGCDNLSHVPRGIEKLTRLQMLCQFVVGKQADSNAATLNQLS
ncbi:disease resistance protein RGA2-like [Punica granatum]|uniref:Disease resistance protein RGA2-like n=1 Tax=Punica granatum TaxID=22663 RepID=A0A6P8BQH7_PUNGR|nr:disease resistance protein RGA2-like [Punica granatum]XP_031372082.1 disease resistance protein RGA2-like [Punica granatum]